MPIVLSPLLHLSFSFELFVYLDTVQFSLFFGILPAFGRNFANAATCNNVIKVLVRKMQTQKYVVICLVILECSNF